jgi:hypothetical protein
MELFLCGVTCGKIGNAHRIHTRSYVVLTRERNDDSAERAFNCFFSWRVQKLTVSDEDVFMRKMCVDQRGNVPTWIITYFVSNTVRVMVS